MEIIKILKTLIAKTKNDEIQWKHKIDYHISENFKSVYHGCELRCGFSFLYNIFVFQLRDKKNKFIVDLHRDYKTINVYQRYIKELFIECGKSLERNKKLSYYQSDKNTLFIPQKRRNSLWEKIKLWFDI